MSCPNFPKVLLQQREDVRAAIVNRGPFRLDPKFIDLQVSQEKWFSMSVKQREQYQNRCSRKKPEDPQNLPHSSLDALPDSCKTVSMSVENAQLGSISLQLVQSCFKKASQLLQWQNTNRGNPWMWPHGISGREHNSKEAPFC